MDSIFALLGGFALIILAFGIASNGLPEIHIHKHYNKKED